ncbi:MAG TPA: hypothetical protein VFD51_00230 [Patescibacteria group bacterium]|nr:hypothetical protein [Patescibacteria group bacterium]
MKKQLNLFLFYFQLILGIIFGSSQIEHMINNSTQGLSLSMFIFAFLFVAVNLTLGIGAHKAKASAVTMQILIILVIGVIIYLLFSLILAIKAEVIWDKNDTITTVIVIIFSLVNFIYSRVKKLNFFNPLIKGGYSLIFKSIPQLFLAYKISQNGGSGLGIVFIFSFHALTLARIFQIFQSMFEAGWDKNRVGLAISEIGNEITWTVVTVMKFI